MPTGVVPVLISGYREEAPPVAVAKVTKEINGKICVTTAFLADTFGVTSKTLAEWEKKGCPKVARGYWDLSAVLKWRDDAINGKAADSVEDMSPIQQKIYWETRCKEEQAENQKLKNAILRGDYLDKTTVSQELMVFFSTLKQAALSVPRKVAITATPYLGGKRARELEGDVMEVIVDVLDQWSGGNFNPAGVDSGGPKNPKTAGKNNGDRVGRQKPVPRSKKQ